MTRCVGVLLLVVCCYAARAAGVPHGGAEQVTWACGKTVIETCSIHMPGPQSPPIRTLRDACRFYQQIHQCVTQTIREECADDAQQLIQLATGTLRFTAENALDFVCEQHISEFTELSECFAETIVSGNGGQLMEFMKCRQPWVGGRGIPDFCEMASSRTYLSGVRLPPGSEPSANSLSEEYECVGEVAGRLCGAEAGRLVTELGKNALDDLGCSDYENSDKLKRKGLDHVADMIRRALNQ